MGTSISSVIEAAVAKHKSWRAAAKHLGIDVAYLYRLANGGKENPSNKTLAKLGLSKSVTYSTNGHGKARPAGSTTIATPRMASNAKLSRARAAGRKNRGNGGA